MRAAMSRQLLQLLNAAELLTFPPGTSLRITRVTDSQTPVLGTMSASPSRKMVLGWFRDGEDANG
jgi:hypothetical protein